MTLVQWKRGTSGNNQTPAYQASAPLMNTELPRLFDTFARPFLRGDLVQDFFDDTMGLGAGSIGTTLPAVNIWETDNELVIEVAAPGLKKNDFKVESKDNQLHIGYSKEGKDAGGQNNYWRREFNFESFERTFSLPALVERERSPQPM